MEILVFLSILTAALAVLSSWYRIRRVKEQIAEIADALADVKNGNGRPPDPGPPQMSWQPPLPMRSMRSLCPMNAGFLRCGRQRRQTASL